MNPSCLTSSHASEIDNKRILRRSQASPQMLKRSKRSARTV